MIFLMMILLKKNVIVKKQTKKINDKEYELFDCDNHEIKGKNGWKLSHDKLFRYFNFYYTKQELLNREEE